MVLVVGLTRAGKLFVIDLILRDLIIEKSLFGDLLGHSIQLSFRPRERLSARADSSTAEAEDPSTARYEIAIGIIKLINLSYY